jgi:hypothetical protein
VLRGRPSPRSSTDVQAPVTLGVVKHLRQHLINARAGMGRFTPTTLRVHERRSGSRLRSGRMQHNSSISHAPVTAEPTPRRWLIPSMPPTERFGPRSRRARWPATFARAYRDSRRSAMAEADAARRSRARGRSGRPCPRGVGRGRALYPHNDPRYCRRRFKRARCAPAHLTGPGLERQHV